MNGYEQFNIVEDYLNLLRRIEKQKLYMIEFNEDGIMKPKVYFFDYIVDDKNKQSIIIITHDKCIFFANNDIKKA